jgi:ABC-type multidrug transport system ATPase subunit
MTLLTASNLHKAYGGTTRLRISELALGEGQRVGIVGRNGSGKSTLLRILAGVVPPTTGTITWAHHPRPRIAYLPQAGGVVAESSLVENLRIRHALFGTSAELPELAARTGIPEEFLNRPINTLSGAYQRIAAFATVLATQPDCLFLDEPLAGLDEYNREKISELINETAAGLKLLVVTEPQGSSPITLDMLVRLEDGSLA